MDDEIDDGFEEVGIDGTTLQIPSFHNEKFREDSFPNEKFREENFELDFDVVNIDGSNSDDLLNGE